MVFTRPRIVSSMTGKGDLNDVLVRHGKAIGINDNRLRNELDPVEHDTNYPGNHV
jgi:hypothetical protein